VFPGRKKNATQTITILSALHQGTNSSNSWSFEHLAVRSPEVKERWKRRQQLLRLLCIQTSWRATKINKGDSAAAHSLKESPLPAMLSLHSHCRLYVSNLNLPLRLPDKNPRWAFPIFRSIWCAPTTQSTMDLLPFQRCDWHWLTGSEGDHHEECRSEPAPWLARMYTPYNASFIFIHFWPKESWDVSSFNLRGWISSWQNSALPTDSTHSSSGGKRPKCCPACFSLAAHRMMRPGRSILFDAGLLRPKHCNRL